MSAPRFAAERPPAMIRVPAVLTAVAALFSAAAFHAPAAEAVAPLEVLGTGHPVAELRIDGQGPYRFIIDTAATRTALLTAFRTAHPVALTSSGTLDVPGASGSAAVETVELQGLEVAGRRLDRLEAWSLPAGPVDVLPVHGVLGADVLKRYAVEMNPAKGGWRLLDSHESQPELSYRPFQLDGGDVPRMTLRINGVDLVAVIDSGAQGSFLNPAAAERLGLSPDDPGARADGRARGTGAGGVAAWSACVADLSYDGRPGTPARLRVAPLPIFEVLGLADRPAIILGYDQLGRGRIVIDYPRSRIGFASPAPSTADCP